jgi:hypothetical protein
MKLIEMQNCLPALLLLYAEFVGMTTGSSGEEAQLEDRYRRAHLSTAKSRSSAMAKR